MRILSLCGKPVPSERVCGVGNAAWNMVKGLSKLGHSVLYLCKTEGWVPRVQSVEGVRTWQLPAFSKMMPWAHRLAILKFKPQIVQIHGHWQISFRKSHMGYKTVGTCHTSLGRNIPNDYDLVICVSRSSKYSVIKSYLGETAVVMSGVNSDFFRPGKWEERDPNLILTVSDINRVKGIDIMARAFLKIWGKRPETRWIHIGKCTDMEHFNEVREIFRGYPISPKFLGYKEHTDLLRFFQKAGIFVSSSHSEGLPLTLLEALACGCPVCVTEIPPHKEIIYEGRNGLMFPRKSHVSLAKILLNLLQEKKLQKKLSIQARTTAEKMGWDRTARNLERNFFKILN